MPALRASVERPYDLLRASQDRDDEEADFLREDPQQGGFR
jgi:hypothetical protein